MKHLLSFLLILIVSLGIATGSLAATAADWTTVGAGPATFEVDGTAIKMTSEGAYPANNNGVLHGNALDMVAGITFEFQVDAFPEAGNCWFGPSVLDKEEYFDISTADKGEGFVFLIWPSGAVQIMGISKDAAAVFDVVYQFWLPGEWRNTPVEMTLKQDSVKGISVWVNGAEMEADRTVNEAYLGLFDGNDAYFAFSSSDLGEGTQSWRILTLNGSPAAEAPATEAPTEAPTGEPNPSTGDPAAMLLMIPAAAAALGALAILRRK